MEPDPQGAVRAQPQNHTRTPEQTEPHPEDQGSIEHVAGHRGHVAADGEHCLHCEGIFQGHREPMGFSKPELFLEGNHSFTEKTKEKLHTAQSSQAQAKS